MTDKTQDSGAHHRGGAMTACTHRIIKTWHFVDNNEPAGFWSCAECGWRFEPIGTPQPAPAASVPSGEPAQIRSDFEQRMVGTGASPSPLSRLKSGEYLSPSIQQAWEAEKRKYTTPQPAPAGWRPIETAPTDMGAHLFLVNGIAVDGFRDATGQMCVRNERHEWRSLRGKPTHWMPLPAAPAAPGGAQP